MAILNITSGSASDLAVVKSSPSVFDCFTEYEYIVSTNPGDSININISGNHYEAKFIQNSGEQGFSDTANVTYGSYLSIKFLLLNSGVASVYSSATITITNTTTSNYYQNFVERTNDGANCYESGVIPTKTSQLLNDGSNGVNPYITATSLTSYLPLAGGTMTGALNMGGQALTNGQNFTFEGLGRIGLGMYFVDTGVNESVERMDVFTFADYFALDPIGTGPRLDYRYSTQTWAVGGNKILTTASNLAATNISYTPYLSLGSTNIQAVINELKDEVDLLGATTIDTVLTDASTNPVENNAIYDEFQLVPYKSTSNTFSGAINTFTQTTVLGGMEFFTAGSNYIDLNAQGLILRTDSVPTAWQINTAGDLTGHSASKLYAATINTDYSAYSAGWNGNLSVPTKDAIYDKIESLSLGAGNVSITGTPVDDQLAVWTSATNIEGTTGLTYNGSVFNVTGNITLSGTVDGFDIAADMAANNAKVSNATHTGDVTGATVLTIAAGAVDIPMLSASGTPSASNFLRGDNTWSVPPGGGDVLKVGTPVNNQIGVWTGDGTIQGLTSLTFNGSTLTTTGKISAKEITGSGTSAEPFKAVGTSTGTGNQVVLGIYESNGTTRQGRLGFISNVNSNLYLYNDVIGTSIYLTGTGGLEGFKYYDGANEWKIWHQGNDGTGSGLDSDLLRGLAPTTNGTASTIAQRTVDGRLVAADAVASNELVTKAQLDAIGTPIYAMTPQSGNYQAITSHGVYNAFQNINTYVPNYTIQANKLVLASITDAYLASNSVTSDKIANNSVNNTKLADMSQNTILGRITASTGDPEYLTPTQVKTMLAIPEPTSGTYTPSIDANGSASYTYNSRAGRYTKVGKLVSFEMEMDVTVTGTPAATVMVCSFLPPFAPTSAAGLFYVSSFTSSGFATGGNMYDIAAYIDCTVDKIKFSYRNDSANNTKYAFNFNQFTGSNRKITISGQYQTP